MKYTGKYTDGKYLVYKDDVELDISRSQQLQKISEHYCWGYYGQGPSQTALAILLDVTNDSDIVLKHWIDFRNEFISTFDMDRDWELDGENIKNWVNFKEID